MPSQYVLASQVSPIHTRRAIRVRLVRSYEVPELRGRAISKSKECLFHDEEVSLIHMFYDCSFLCLLLVFVEGKVYSIKNFLVVTNYYTYKTSPHKYLIKFNYSTTIKESKSSKFPNFMFRLKSFQSSMDSTTLNDKKLFGIYFFSCFTVTLFYLLKKNMSQIIELYNFYLILI
nr:replication factor A protein 1-like [Ipomoea batatas]